MRTTNTLGVRLVRQGMVCIVMSSCGSSCIKLFYGTICHLRLCMLPCCRALRSKVLHIVPDSLHYSYARVVHTRPTHSALTKHLNAVLNWRPFCYNPNLDDPEALKPPRSIIPATGLLRQICAPGGCQFEHLTAIYRTTYSVSTMPEVSTYITRGYERYAYL